MKQIFLYTSLAVMALAVMTTGAAPRTAPRFAFKGRLMKKQNNSTIKAHLLRSALFLLPLLAVCMIPFALAQRQTNAPSLQEGPAASNIHQAQAEQRLQIRLIPVPISISQFRLQRQGNFREGMGNGLRFRITRNDGHNPKQEREITL